MNKIKIEIDIPNKLLAEIIARSIKIQLISMKKQYPAIQDVKVEVTK